MCASSGFFSGEVKAGTPEASMTVSQYCNTCSGFRTLKNIAKCAIRKGFAPPLRGVLSAGSVLKTVAKASLYQ